MDLPKSEATTSKRRSYSDDFKQDAVRLVADLVQMVSDAIAMDDGTLAATSVIF